MKCEIRKWKVEDAKDLSLALSNPSVLRNLRDGLPYPYTEKDGLDYINLMLSSDENSTFAYAIVVDGKVAGSVGAFRQGNIHFRTAEIGYYLAEKYWSKGIMSDAVRQLCDYIFSNTDIIRIFAEPFSYNTGSCRVLEHNGFEFEGLLRQNAYKDGRILDMKMYSLIKK